MACRAVAWGRGGKEVAFVTDRPEMPVVQVHLTFYRESEPWIPATWVYGSVGAFVRERQQVEERKRELRRRSRSEGAA